MKAPFAPAAWLVSGFLLLPWCASPASSAAGTKTQHGQLLLNEKGADVSLTKDREQLSLTISAKLNKGHPLDWSRVKASVSCSQGRGDLGDFRFDMTLASTNTQSGKRASALFVFKAEPSVIDQVADVRVEAYSNACCFNLPLSREEVVARFRARGSAEELRQFEELAALERQVRSGTRVRARAFQAHGRRVGGNWYSCIGREVTVWRVVRTTKTLAMRFLRSCGWPRFTLTVIAMAAGWSGWCGGRSSSGREGLCCKPRTRACARMRRFRNPNSTWSGVCGVVRTDEATCNAIQETLGRAQIAASSLGNCGCLNFYVTKEQFFQAGRALLQAKDRRVRAGALWPPRFSL